MQKGGMKSMTDDCDDEWEPVVLPQVHVTEFQGTEG